MTSELCPATGLPIGLPVQQVAQPKYPAHCTLPGRFVTLVPLVADKHANGLYAETHGSESGAYWQYMGDGPYPDFESFEASMRGKAASTDPLFFVVMCNSSHQPLGYLTLMRIDVANRVVEVGNVLFGRSLQRTPGATEAQYLLAAYAFETLGYRRLEWKCNALNAPSRRAAQRLGFTFEGVFRQHMVVKGRNRDTAWFSMLDTEWSLRKGAFERWLGSENFDAEGRQRESLEAIREAL